MRTVSWIFLFIVLGVIPALAHGPLQIEGSAYGGTTAIHSLTEAFCCTTAIRSPENLPIFPSKLLVEPLSDNIIGPQK